VGRHVQLGPEKLGQARLAANLGSGLHSRHGSERVEPVGLSVQTDLQDPIAQAGVRRVAAFPPQLNEPIGCREKSSRTAQGQPAFTAGGGHRHPPAAVHLAEHVDVGNEDVIQEDLRKSGIAIELVHRSDGDARGAQIDHEIGQSPVGPIGVGVGAKEAVETVAPHSAGTPGLLSAETPAPVDTPG
jgi:hypothetical protein